MVSVLNHAAPHVVANIDPLVESWLAESIAVKQRVFADKDLLAAVDHVARKCAEACLAGHKVLFAGNGGSAADAQHLAGEFVSRFNYDRPGLSSFALTVDTSVLTAIGNDYGYDKLFEPGAGLRQDG
jgi:D-sedoheptulose 7-phosphate isomerase